MNPVPMSQRVLWLIRRWVVIHSMLAIWYLGVSLTVHDSVLRTTWMPATMRFALIVEEWAWMLIPAFIIAIPQKRPLRWVLGVPIVLLLAGSWGAFESTGRFASLDTFKFFLVVPKQSIEHAEELYHGVLTQYLFMALSGVLVLISGELARYLAVLARSRIVILLGVIALSGLAWESHISTVLARSTGDIDDLDTGVSYSSSTLWRDLRRHTSGPGTTLFRSIAAAFQPTGGAYAASPLVRMQLPDRTERAAATPLHRWNVLVIVVESMRRDILFSDDSLKRIMVMPNSYAIGLQSLRYLDTYTTATQTNLAAPVPLSGQYPLRWERMGPYPTQITWPRVMLHDVLKPAGWRTGVFSSQNEEWWGMARLLKTPSLDTLFHAQSYAGDTYLPRGDVGFAKFVRKSKKSGKIDDYDTASEAIAWMEHDRTTPFMLAVNFQNSHLPYGTPAGAARRFGHQAPSFPILFGRFPEESVSVVRDEYRNALAYVDNQIGRLRASLEADGRWDSTIVIITGDHGQAFFEHQLAAHANGLWQEQVRVPLMIRIPGRESVEDHRAASHLDIAPTIIDALGLPQEAAWQGASLLGPVAVPERPRFFMVQTPLAHEIGMIAGPWKIVLDLERGISRLTDLANDPREQHDLSTDAPGLTARLSGILRTWEHEQLAYYGTLSNSDAHYPPRIALDSPLVALPFRPR